MQHVEEGGVGGIVRLYQCRMVMGDVVGEGGL